MITISDNEKASCSTNPSLVEEMKGEKDGRGKDEMVSRNPDGPITERRQGKLIILKKRGRKKKIRRQALGIEDLGSAELYSEDSEVYDVLSAPEMGATAMECLEDVEKIRVKCENLKGDLSGVIKRRSKLKEIVKGLVKSIEKESNRKEGEEEVSLLKMRNRELEARLKRKERDNHNREKEIELLHKVIKELREELNALKEKVISLEKKDDRRDTSSKRKKISKGSIGGRNPTYRRDRIIDASMNERETSHANSDTTIYTEEWDGGEIGWGKYNLSVTGKPPPSSLYLKKNPFTSSGPSRKKPCPSAQPEKEKR